MKKKKLFKIREKKGSGVFLTKLETTDEYFEENYSPFIVVRVGKDLENIRKAYQVLLDNPLLEEVKFFINNAFVLPNDIYRNLSCGQSDDLYARLYRDRNNEIIEICDIDTHHRTIDLAYATIKRSCGDFELYYEGFVETMERTHVQSNYFDLFSVLGINQEEEVLA